MDCSPPDSSIHGIFQARILDWVTISFSRDSSWPMDWNHVSYMGRQILYHRVHNKCERRLFTFLAAAAAKSLQSCPTRCDPIDSSSPGSPVPGILQARTLEWVAISFSSAWKWKVKVKSLGRVQLLATPWAAAHQAPPSMGFSRQEYWSGVPLPSPSHFLHDSHQFWLSSSIEISWEELAFEHLERYSSPNEWYSTYRHSLYQSSWRGHSYDQNQYVQKCRHP